MKTERVFLMELFLDDKLPKCIKEKIKDRFQEMDEPNTPISYTMTESNRSGGLMATKLLEESGFPPQAPSMQRLMQQNPDLIPKPPVPVTPAAAQALAARAALLASAGGEKPEPGRKSPRKI